MTLLILLLIGGGSSFDERLAAADRLGAIAREEKTPEAFAKALAAYDALIAERPKDQKLVPRLRRRRSSLLKSEGRILEALTECDLVLSGPARRKDKARALLEGADLHVRAGDLHAAERRLARAVEEYPDVLRVRAEASLARGRILAGTTRRKEAEACFRHVVERCKDEEKIAIEAYDELALLAIADGDRRKAQQWLKACTDRYAKRAARGDKFGAFLSRQLGAMKAPGRLLE